MSKNYSNGHKSETDQKKKKKKKADQQNIFLHLCAHFWVQIPNTHRYKELWLFSTPGQSALNGPPKRPNVNMVKNPK